MVHIDSHNFTKTTILLNVNYVILSLSSDVYDIYHTILPGYATRNIYNIVIKSLTRARNASL